MSAQTAMPHESIFRKNRGAFAAIILLALMPFLIALLDGQSVSDLLANEGGQSKFFQGLLIEVFILGIYALSYDLVLGITGLLSFGHAMFYGVGAYLTGIMLKSFGWGLLPTVGAVIVAGFVMAVLFSIVLPRVKGITFALVTLGIAYVFYIIIQSRELAKYAGAEIGLQGVHPPDFLNPASERIRFYFVALALLFIVYFFYQRFVDSPTGRVCIAIRENEDRAIMLGYNTFWFKFVALVIAAITAALAGAVHALYAPIIRPDAAGLSFTIAALLMILIGGMGTLSGAIVGAAVFRLLSFFLERLVGGESQIMIGLVYVAIVLFLPYGIIGTWKARRLDIRRGWERLLERLGLRKADSG